MCIQGVQEPLQDKSPQSRELRQRILGDHPKSKTGRGGVTITHLDCNLTHENEIWDLRMGTRMDVQEQRPRCIFDHLLELIAETPKPVVHMSLTRTRMATGGQDLVSDHQEDFDCEW